MCNHNQNPNEIHDEYNYAHDNIDDDVMTTVGDASAYTEHVEQQSPITTTTSSFDLYSSERFCDSDDKDDDNSFYRDDDDVYKDDGDYHSKF